MPESHILLMTSYAFLVSMFFALLWRDDRRGRTRLFLQIFLAMIGGGLLLAWIMYALPSSPPVPIP